MGKWITPKVVIEKFAPNQYVAACSVEVPSFLNYVDAARGKVLDPYYIAINGWGDPDHHYQMFETITDRDGATIQFDTIRLLDFDSPSEEWRKGIYFYENRRSLLSSDPLAYFGRSDQYDIWVYENGNRWYADVYTIGAADAAASGKDPANHS